MMKDLEQGVEGFLPLNAIVENLSFYCGYLPTNNLYEGKMGVLLALALYAKNSNDTIFNDQVIWLFEQIINNLDYQSGIRMEDGLVGVAYGIVLLHLIGIVDGDLDDALAEIDARIMEYDPRRMQDHSFRRGVGGIVAYVKLRSSIDPRLRTFDVRYLQDLHQSYLQLNEGKRISSPTQLLDNLDTPSFAAIDFAGKPIWLSGGLSYYLFKKYNALLPF